MRVRDLHQHDARRVEQPLDVLGQPEDGGAAVGLILLAIFMYYVGSGLGGEAVLPKVPVQLDREPDMGSFSLFNWLLGTVIVAIISPIVLAPIALILRRAG